jgi:membrane protein YqaA with SNARE-associated domain
VLGACFGYVIGRLFYETVGRPIVNVYDLHEEMQQIGELFARNGFLTVLTAAFTPIPYKVITIGAGLFELSILTLLGASILGRGARFFIVAGLIRIFGKSVTEKIEKYFDLFSLLFMALLILGFVAIKYLF